jgi:hypothetical protein
MGKLHLIPLLSSSGNFTDLVHTLYVLPLVPVGEVVDVYEVGNKNSYFKGTVPPAYNSLEVVWVGGP